MFSVERLLESDCVSIFRVDHADEAPPAIEEELCTHYSICFVERGEFALSVEDRTWPLRPGAFFLSHPESIHAYSHPALADDTCLSVHLRGALASEIEAHGSLAAAAQNAAGERTNRLAFLRWRLDRVLGTGDIVEVQEWAGELIEAVRRGANGRAFRAAQLDSYARRIETTRQAMRDDCSAAHSLVSLASAAAMSPFHYARLFRELTGVPPHHYLRELRLARARTMLAEGASVTTTCYAVGFGNLSHFIRSYRRRFGEPPSHLRKKVQASGARARP